MKIEYLADIEDNSVIAVDLVIVGAGPAGLTVAAQCARSGKRVLVVESGLEFENSEHAALNEVENAGEPCSDQQFRKRREFHGPQAGFWSHEVQPFGVRCRALGGSTHAWAGKSAPFDAMDFQSRPWVPYSGWPVDHRRIEAYVERAMEVLNLCPEAPPGRFDREGLQSFHWQFARSRVDRLDVMRFGRELLARRPRNTRVLLDASVTHIGLSPDGSRFSHVDVASIKGKRARIEARICVVAASGIENARLLLASNDVHARGIGNQHDVVGRYLMDHAATRVGRFSSGHMANVGRFFGFYGVSHKGRGHMFMHGLALTPEIQRREGLLNAAIYFATERAPDDPWDALKKLLRRRSTDLGRDLRSVVAGSGLIARGAGMKILSSERTPRLVKDLVVNTAIRLSPNMVADEFQSRGLPHKLAGLRIEAICEQAPDPDSRISLGSRRDRFGVPLARADWRINGGERQTLLRIAELSGAALASANLPVPVLEDWAVERRPQDIVVIDMAHTLGTTRMSASPKTGVVDENCKVHGLPNLYIAGGSVFPTSGHANPTLMILAFAIKLADHLGSQLEGL
ncbi:MULTISPECIES: GMC oxidoreductase [Alphaproteobacteria]|uniref:GMC oxidoreductase n=2 Tax=Alphaproteobacteria TaxID=28211 RepID=A0A512HN40_9HYPH|nr:MULTISPECIES: GMC family oxidoreductase [Alphaproteobacteria]GEO86861.1 GMC oxidoreductase [Ciceribacter naphthalenivorans]GLR24005.1 GMC oxidoreductase [Ciceribacter naphthalenivorans]GLT06861.1 GMC oxidoreductase [Sphingomonas psychrolutea]